MSRFGTCAAAATSDVPADPMRLTYICIFMHKHLGMRTSMCMRITLTKTYMHAHAHIYVFLLRSQPQLQHVIHREANAIAHDINVHREF